MIKVLPLVGYKSLRALNAFHMIMMGLKMIPIYAFIPYEEFYAMFDEKTEEEKELFLREGLAIIKLEDDEIDALIGFCVDKNGVAYGKNNIKNLDLKIIYDCCLAVMIEISKIEISFITESEKKKLGVMSVDLRKTFLKFPLSSLEEVLNIAFFEAKIEQDELERIKNYDERHSKN